MTIQIPTRLRTLINLTGLLKTITPSAGYQNDLSDYQDHDGVALARVFRGRNTFGDDDPLSMVSILENPHAEPTQHESPRGSSIVHGPWELLLQGWAKDDAINPTDPAHYLMADVKKCLIAHQQANSPNQGNPNPNLLGMGRAVDDYTVGTGVVRPFEDPSVKVCFWLMLTLTMSEDMANPFA